MPYLTLGAWTQVGSHSFTPNAGSPDVTGYGWNCTGQFTVVGQKSATWDEPALMAVMSHVFAALPQKPVLLWNDGPRMQQLFRKLEDHELTPGDSGKDAHFR